MEAHILFRYPHLVVLLLAIGAADLAVALLARLGRNIGAVDRPGAETYKVQAQAVPFVGGIGLFIAFFTALFVTLNWELVQTRGADVFLSSHDTKVAFATVLGGAAMAILGLLDDFKPIPAAVKLLIMTVITFALVMLGLMVTITGYALLDAFLTLLWVIGIVSAFNAIDNSDGIAGTTAASVAGWTFLVAWGTTSLDAQRGQSFLAIALLGAVLGFLRHNRPPARVYLGNSGAFLLGFVIAVMSISGRWTEKPLHSALAPILLLSYPLFDLVYTVFLRWHAGVVRNLYQAVVVSGRDHTAHRLAALGLNKWEVIGVIAVINGIAGAAAYVIVRYDPSTPLLAAVVGGCVVMYLAFAWSIRNAVDLKSDEARLSRRAATEHVVVPKV